MKNRLRRYSWTNDQLIEAVKDSSSIRQVLLKMNLNATGGNYQAIPKRIKELGLDVTHFSKKSLSKPPICKPIPWSEKLVENSDYCVSIGQKKRMIKEGLLENKCNGCGILLWTAFGIQKELQLQLDHINGKKLDNRLENLRLLCPNCHSMTDTFAGKNQKKKATFLFDSINPPCGKDFCICGKFKNKKAKTCKGCMRKGRAVTLVRITKCECGQDKNYRSRKCKECSHKNVEYITWPSDTELLKMVKAEPFTTVAKKLGVSDNAIRHRLKRRNLLPITTD